MPDRPTATTATHAVLYGGYASPGVAATVGLISDGQRRVIHTVRWVGYLPREDQEGGE
jgi:hypothetical protein